MANQLDVYRDWLGIKETVRPLNYYQLLRLNSFEDDAVRIRANYRKLNAHIRKYSGGEYAQQSQELLNELAKAMLCLTDTKRKGEYDASLGRKVEKDSRPRTFEELLIARQVLDMAKLDRARKLADTISVDIRDAVMQQKLASAEMVMQVYAESQGLPFVELSELEIDPTLVPQIPAILARQHSLVPLMADSGQILIVSPNPLRPEIEDQIRLRTGLLVRTVLCTPTDIHAAINKHYPRESAAAELTKASTAGENKAPASTTPSTSGPKPSAKLPVGESVQLVIVTFNFSITFIFLALYYLMGYSLIVSLGIGGLAAGIIALLVYFLKAR